MLFTATKVKVTKKLEIIIFQLKYLSFMHLSIAVLFLRWDNGKRTSGSWEGKLVLFSASEGFKELLSFFPEFMTSPNLVSRWDPSSDIFDKKLIAASLLRDCCLLTRVAIWCWLLQNRCDFSNVWLMRWFDVLEWYKDEKYWNRNDDTPNEWKLKLWFSCQTEGLKGQTSIEGISQLSRKLHF